ncbi:O-antigen ligase family protein [Candidatus Pelagibacter sp.]|nr:O-antigen ligase family protein [Candidatus Pelagibacter sp.]
MFKANLKDNHLLILVSTIPLSILVGASVSLINIILILFSFLYHYKNKNYSYLFKNKIFILLISIYTYLLLNSLISIDFNIGFLRNFGFLRFILLFFAINYLFFKNKNVNFVFIVWLTITFIVLLDSYFEFFVGKNVLGYSDTTGSRIVSFFKNEPIVAGYLNGFIFIIFGFLFSNFDKKNLNKKFFVFFIILSFFFCILITGERSNTLKFLFGLILFMSLNHFINYKFKLFFVLLIVLLFSFSYFNSDKIKLRYGGQLIHLIDNKEKRETYLKNNLYINHYKSGIEVFKKYPMLGVGNKNYRIETCKNNLDEKYICSTHPHQIYLEFLSEHGLFGSMLLLSIILFSIFRNFKMMIGSKNLIQIGSFCYLLSTFLPILPSGSFFNDFNATLFWINFSIFYASNSRSNIFKMGD